jgi:hypothetical protein
MNEQYLWDGSGEADPEIQQIEKALSDFRYRPRGLRAQPEVSPEPLRKRHYWWMAVAAAASLAFATFMGLRLRQTFATADSGWKISWNGSQASPVRSGQIVDTGRHSTAQISSAFIGEVRLDSGSRLKVLRASQSEQRLALEHGTIHAFIWAPPGQFVVDTPSARTVDLGCQYTLHVDKHGNGVLRVETGWVAFQWQNAESFIPAGAECRTRPVRGPGTPYYDDAPAALAAALTQFDETHSAAALRTVLISARPHDALTIWHLLARTNGAERSEVFTRFGELVSLPPTITRQSILRGDPSAIDAAWNALGLGNTDWWREWKRRW